jgi:Methyltransferase FkbM domain
MKSLRKLIANALTRVCSGLIYLLHNRASISFSRLELQSVEFSFSQFGEDLVIKRLAEDLGLTTGIYVDAGAYHPVFGSNTLLLYKKGWRGINVDLAAGRIAEFDRYRPNDHNVVACVSDKVAPVEIAHYEIPSTDRVVEGGDAEKLSVVGFEPVRFSCSTTTTLTQIIQGSPFRFEDIQYLNVDCEGHDLAVLRGFDFTRCRPRIISVEATTGPERQAIFDFLFAYGYRLEATIPPTCIFVGNRSSES